MMSLKVLLFASTLSFLGAVTSLAVLAQAPQSFALTPASITQDFSISKVIVLETTTQTVIATPPFILNTIPILATAPSSSLPPSPVATTLPSSSTSPLFVTITSITTLTDTITAPGVPVTVTVPAIPSTLTSTTTVFLSRPLTSAPPSPSAPAEPQKTWYAPIHMTNLDSFKISGSPPHRNFKIVNGIPASASATSHAEATRPTGVFIPPTWDNASSVFELFYPEGSINPGNKPIGGAQFYALPIDLERAKSVTMRYSVFFPRDFAWVLAGKLPGLYGGRKGCSGGDAALDCFSTRLMWRKNGMGELYLYAPKDKQTKSLCNDRQSVCDAAYGLSVGRGSFFWAAGSWTTVEQTAVLNTPGKQNGYFCLLVNGKKVIERDDIYYRGGGGEEDDDDDDEDENDGGLLGKILGGLEGVLLDRGLIPRSQMILEIAPTAEPTPGTAGMPTTTSAIGPSEISAMQAAVVSHSVSMKTESSIKPVGFAGIFFSTFFGGHAQQYASPKDQYVWFKDFALSNNA